jgi:hypothetical protein
MFHSFFKVKVVVCAEGNQNEATGRKFDVSERFMR